MSDQNKPEALPLNRELPGEIMVTGTQSLAAPDQNPVPLRGDSLRQEMLDRLRTEDNLNLLLTGKEEPSRNSMSLAMVTGLLMRLGSFFADPIGRTWVELILDGRTIAYLATSPEVFNLLDSDLFTATGIEFSPKVIKRALNQVAYSTLKGTRRWPYGIDKPVLQAVITYVNKTRTRGELSEPAGPAYAAVTALAEAEGLKISGQYWPKSPAAMCALLNKPESALALAEQGILFEEGRKSLTRLWLFTYVSRTTALERYRLTNPLVTGSSLPRHEIGEAEDEEGLSLPELFERALNRQHAEAQKGEAPGANPTT